MTAATKTKPTKTGEEELADVLTQHRGVLAQFEEQASAWDQLAIELDARAESALADFSGPVTELPKGVDEDRTKALRKRQGAADLRKRAQAYAANVGLEAIAAEHETLRQERIAAEELEAATKEVEALVPELEIRAAWLYWSHLQAAAVRQRYLEAGNRLMDLLQRHHLPVDSTRYTTLAVQAQEAAGRELRTITASNNPDLWRQNLPTLTRLELPAELRTSAPGSVSPTSDQRPPYEPGRRNLPKDYEIRMAGAAVPSPRNADGTIEGGSVHHPLEGMRTAVVPRTVVEERAALAKVAADLEPDKDGGGDA
jgi:hypothetical protein